MLTAETSLKGHHSWWPSFMQPPLEARPTAEEQVRRQPLSWSSALSFAVRFFAASFATSLAAWLTATAAASSAAFLALLRNVFGTGNVLNLVWIHLDSSWS